MFEDFVTLVIGPPSLERSTAISQRVYLTAKSRRGTFFPKEILDYGCRNQEGRLISLHSSDVVSLRGYPELSLRKLVHEGDVKFELWSPV